MPSRSATRSSLLPRRRARRSPRRRRRSLPRTPRWLSTRRSTPTARLAPAA